MTDPLLKNHADMMLAVEAGYDYAPNIAQDMADRIKELEADYNKLAAQSYYREIDLGKAEGRIKVLEAKLAKARNEALEEAANELLSIIAGHKAKAKARGTYPALTEHVAAAIRAMMEDEDDE
jgi:hypothetical protein